MRHTRAHTANRRSHHGLKAQNLSMCPDCGAPKLSHTMCMNCGKYKGKVVVDVAASIAKKEQKAKERNRELAGTPEKVEEAKK